MKSRAFVVVFLTLLSLFISCSAPTHAAASGEATAAAGQAPRVFLLNAAILQNALHQQIEAIKPSELVGVLYQAAAHYHQTAYWQAIRSIEGSSANNDVDNLLYGDA